MDSVQDILILLFIVFSIVSSLLKKKKGKENEKGTKVARPSAKKPAFDLEELLGIQTPPLTPQKSVSEVDAYFAQTGDEDKYEATYQEPKEETYAEKREKKIREIEYFKQKKKKKKKIETTVKSISQPSQSYSFRKKLHNASSLREYVIMNEILGKPISLRE